MRRHSSIAEPVAANVRSPFAASARMLCGSCGGKQKGYSGLIESYGVKPLARLDFKPRVLQWNRTCGPTRTRRSVSQLYTCTMVGICHFVTFMMVSGHETHEMYEQHPHLPAFANADCDERLAAPPLHCKRHVVCDVAQRSEGLEQR